MPASLAYDTAENIIHMSFADPEDLATRAQIAAHFQRVIDFWKKNCNGKKAYFVVDFENVTVSVTELEFYAQETKHAHEVCAITSVRYGGNPLQRTVTRLAGMKIHRPSNIYQTREEALAVVRELKRGAIKATNVVPTR